MKTNNNKKRLIRLMQWARLHHQNYQTARSWAMADPPRISVEHVAGAWLIDADEPPPKKQRPWFYAKQKSIITEQ